MRICISQGNTHIAKVFFTLVSLLVMASRYVFIDQRKVQESRDNHIFCALAHPLLTFKLLQLSFAQVGDYNFSSKTPYRCRIDSVLPHNQSLC